MGDVVNDAVVHKGIKGTEQVAKSAEQVAATGAHAAIADAWSRVGPGSTQNPKDGNASAWGEISRSKQCLDSTTLCIPRDVQGTRSPQDRAKIAQNKLDASIGDSLPEADRKGASDLSAALLKGDSSQIGAALSAYKDNPEKLKQAVLAIDGALKSNGSDTGVALNKDGNLVMYGPHSDIAVQVSPDGKSTVRPITRDSAGNVILTAGEVIGATPEKTLQDLSASTVRDLTSFGILRPTDKLPPGIDVPRYPDQRVPPDWNPKFPLDRNPPKREFPNPNAIPLSDHRNQQIPRSND